MNRKGFTLIELLAVIVVLGLVVLISVPIISDAYTKSKIKSEEVFVDRLTQAIDSYVKLNEIEYKSTGNGKKTENGKEYDITYQKGTITIQKIIDDGILTQKDFVNAGNSNKAGNNNKDTTCNTAAEVEVYKDSDFVYCYKMKKNSLNCLTDAYKETIDGDYVIDTCVWKESQG